MIHTELGMLVATRVLLLFWIFFCQFLTWFVKLTAVICSDFEWYAVDLQWLQYLDYQKLLQMTKWLESLIFFSEQHIFAKVPYILAYKSQNFRQNLDLKVRGGDLYVGHKIKNFCPAAEIRSFPVSDELVTAALLRRWQSKLLDGRPCSATWQRPCVTSHGDGSRDGTL